MESRARGKEHDELVIPPAFSARCALCWQPFKLGDGFKSIWQRPSGPPQPAAGRRMMLGISVHQSCFGELDPEDLTRIFGALERGLALPLACLRQAVGK